MASWLNGMPKALEKDVHSFTTKRRFLPWVSMHHAGSRNGKRELFIWEANQPEAVSRIEAHNNGIFAMAWSRDSHWLTGGATNALRSGAEPNCATNGPHSAEKIGCMVHGPDSTFIGTTAGKAFLPPRSG